MKELKANEGWDEKAPISESRDYYLQLTTEVLLSRQENILIIDVSSPNNRLYFEKALINLQYKLKSSQLYNFESYSAFLGKFQIVLELVLDQYMKMIESHETSKYHSIKNQQSVQLKQFEIDELQKENVIIKLKCAQSFYPNREPIQNIETSLSGLRNTLIAYQKCKKRK